MSRRTATINQIRAFLIEQGIAVRSGPRALRNSLFAILENRKDEISPRTAKLIRGLHEDWCCLDERIETVTGEIETLSQAETKRRRLQSVPGIGPLTSTAMVAAIGTARLLSVAATSPLGSARAAAAQHWRAIDPWPHLQAWQQISAHTVDPGGKGPTDAAA